MKVHKHEVVIAGAGPVGLTAALALVNHGLHPLVLETKSRGVTHSYALALHPASLELFGKLGVLPEIVDRALLVRKLSIYVGGSRIASEPIVSGDHPHPYLAVLGQDVLEAILDSALEKRASPVRWNHRLARFEQHDDRVRATVAELEERIFGYAAARFDWDVKSEFDVESSFMIGADGHHSLVRRQLEIDFLEVKPAEHYAVFEFESGGAMENEVAIVLHEDGPGVLWPLPEGRARWSFAVDPSQYPEANREKDHDPVQLAGAGVFPALKPEFFEHLLTTRAPWFTTPVGHLYWRMLVRFERRLASSFGDRRIWLAGDAAHVTAPGGIQSMNIGLTEAVDLANAIHEDLEAGSTSTSAAIRFGERARNAWQEHFNLADRIEVAPTAPEAIEKHRGAIMSSLPASGDDLLDLAGRFGLGVSVEAG